MEFKLGLAKTVACLFYIVGGFGLLTALIGFLSGAKNFYWNGVLQIFVILCAGLFFDLLSDIGWRVFLSTVPQKTPPQNQAQEIP